MKGAECRLLQFIDGANKKFVIPVYQRNYDWRLENCKQLYDDLIKVSKNPKRNSHFFGSVVSAYRATGRSSEYLIIDGQQRLTTVSLLLLAMYNALVEGKVTSETETLSQQISENYLIDKFQPAEKRIKLKPVKNDQIAFSKLFEADDEYILDSNVTSNYKYFYERIQKQEIGIDELYDALFTLEIINIELQEEDNPQLIFESLNSTGLDLSEGDKIRNYILMGLPSNTQEEYYDKYWNKIEILTKYDVSSFIRDYLSVKQRRIVAQKKVYLEFKGYVEHRGVEIPQVLEEILAYAKRYQYLLGAPISHKVIDACIYRLNRLETTVIRPFFLSVLELYDTNVLTINEVAEMLITTENYLFRRNICELGTNALNKIFLLLHKEILRLDGTTNNYVSKYKYILLSKNERARFPNDDEFKTSLTNRQVYLMNSKNKIYLLERFENYGTNEDKDIYRHYDDGNYSVEHIMPQNLNSSWISALGENYSTIHELWLHRLANITLTAYNSKYSNRSFEDKKNIVNGFIDSGIRMNTYIAKFDKWTVDELLERNEYLLDRALHIWSYPQTDYVLEEELLESYTLDDEVDFTGKIIEKYSYLDIEYNVDSWVDAYQSIILMLYQEDCSIINHLSASTEDGIATHFSMVADSFVKSFKIDENVFTSINTNTKSKVNVLNRLFELYNVPKTNLIFYIGNECITNIDDGDEIRRRYWKYALECINEKMISDTFTRMKPVRGSWISGVIGIPGITLTCITNFSSLRVELTINTESKIVNKDIFDKLFAYKNMIESDMECSLEWVRNSDSRLSKVNVSMQEIELEDESKWANFASFHAKWLNEFYIKLVPWVEKVI